MDSDFWTSRLAAAKRQFNRQHHHSHGGGSHHHQHHHHNHSHHGGSYLGSQFDRLNIDEIEIEEETRPDLLCPYCYEEFDYASLCFHLEDEHSSDYKVTVCPICSTKVARDMLSHITLQHGHLFKIPRRRGLRRVPVPSSQALSLLGRDLREAHLQVLLGGSGYRSNNASASNAIMDPLLASLVLSSPTSEAEEISKSAVSSVEDSTARTTTSQKAWKSRFDPSLSYEERQKRIRQAAGRAVFIQDLLVSTLLAE